MTPQQAGASDAYRVDLLILQPSPFCNIDCDYCYLADRSVTRRMPLPIVRRAVERVFEADLVGDELSIVWHAGEPLAVPISYYEQAFADIASIPPRSTRIRHSIQSNGILISDAWCSFLKEHDVRLGLSIDGPQHIHDAHRKTRRGDGTHDRVMRAVETLRRNGVYFHVIAVISAQSLDFADEIFDFFLELGIRELGFNIEEIEGAHPGSSLTPSDAQARLRDFMLRIHDRQRLAGDRLRIREFDRTYNAIARRTLPTGELPAINSDLTRPFGIVSVDSDGNFSMFSPELLGIKSERYGTLSFGNVLTDELRSVFRNTAFLRVLEDVEEGVRRCAAGCEYFSLCGGGAPSNKYFEHGTFSATETLYCRNTVQLSTDIVLADLERSLGLA